MNSVTHHDQPPDPAPKFENTELPTKNTIKAQTTKDIEEN